MQLIVKLIRTTKAVTSGQSRSSLFVGCGSIFFSSFHLSSFIFHLSSFFHPFHLSSFPSSPYFYKIFIFLRVGACEKWIQGIFPAHFLDPANKIANRPSKIPYLSGERVATPMHNHSYNIFGCMTDLPN